MCVCVCSCLSWSKNEMIWFASFDIPPFSEVCFWSLAALYVSRYNYWFISCWNMLWRSCYQSRVSLHCTTLVGRPVPWQFFLLALGWLFFRWMLLLAATLAICLRTGGQIHARCMITLFYPMSLILWASCIHNFITSLFYHRILNDFLPCIIDDCLPVVSLCIDPKQLPSSDRCFVPPVSSSLLCFVKWRMFLLYYHGNVWISMQEL